VDLSPIKMLDSQCHISEIKRQITAPKTSSEGAVLFEIGVQDMATLCGNEMRGHVMNIIMVSNSYFLPQTPIDPSLIPLITKDLSDCP
jgi:hypothetical protein